MVENLFNSTSYYLSQEFSVVINNFIIHKNCHLVIESVKSIYTTGVNGVKKQKKSKLLFVNEYKSSIVYLSLFLSSPADALTAVLTKINRLDIVTLLEGPIFDYGNITGTRCFADDNAVFPDQSDGKV